MEIERDPNGKKIITVNRWKELLQLSDDVKQDAVIIVINKQPRGRCPRDLSYLFANFKQLIHIIGLENIETRKVRSFNSLFANCYNLRYADLSQFDTHNVRDFSSMFYNCKRLWDLDLNHFTAQRALTIDDMFHGCEFLRTLSLCRFALKDGVDTNNVFTGCSQLQYLEALPRIHALYQQAHKTVVP